RVTDNGNPNDGLFVIDSNGTGGFASQTIANPTNSLIIRGNAGNDTITLDSLDPAFSAAITVEGGAGNDTLIVKNGFSAQVSFDGGGGTNAVVNRQALGTNLTLANVQTNVDRPLLFIPGFGGTGANFNEPNGYQKWLLTRGPDPADLSLEPLTFAYSDMV